MENNEEKNKYLSLDGLQIYNALIKEAIQSYADSVAAQKSQVQIITWEADD